MRTSVPEHEAAATFESLIGAVEHGAEFEITRDGEIVALLLPFDRPVRSFGLDRGAYLVPEDFDAPLPEDLLDAFEA